MDIFKKETRASKTKTKLDKDEIKKNDNRDHEVRKRNEHGKLRVRGKGDYPENSSSSENSDDYENNYGKNIIPQKNMKRRTLKTNQKTRKKRKKRKVEKKKEKRKKEIL